MKREIAARRYAEAIFQIARSTQTIDQWRSDLQSVAGVFGDPEVLGLLENATVPPPAKEDVLNRTLAGISPLAMNYARLLVQRRRVALAPQIADDFRALADDYIGVAHAEVTTVVDLDDNEKRLIAEQLSRITGKNVDVQVHTDPSILGGMIARVGDTLIDGSTRTRLQALRQRLEAAR
jgi:F-type H+-transporting ATPase subunit delta